MMRDIMQEKHNNIGLALNTAFPSAREGFGSAGWNQVCSHGGGRFGQSLTAIAKLAPEADMGEGLSVHYSGGSELPNDVSDWLRKNGIQ